LSIVLTVSCVPVSRSVSDFHTSLLSLLFLASLASPALLSTVLVPLCDARRYSRDRKPMPNPEIAITIHDSSDTLSRPTEDFELVRHPNHQHTDWKSSHRQEELPFYMAEDTPARRRVTHLPQNPTPQQRNPRWDDEYDGEGKDVYAKASASQRYGGGGRVVRRAPPPPPTSFVGLCTASSHPTSLTINPAPPSPFPHLARVFPAKFRACRTCRVHPLVLLDTVSQDRRIAERDMGRGALWQVRFALPQARVLL
jgi:hypothetical protein